MKPTPSDFVFLPLFRFFVFFLCSISVFFSQFVFFFDLSKELGQRANARDDDDRVHPPRRGRHDGRIQTLQEPRHPLRLRRLPPGEGGAFRFKRRDIFVCVCEVRLVEMEVRFDLREGTYICVCEVRLVEKRVRCGSREQAGCVLCLLRNRCDTVQERGMGVC